MPSETNHTAAYGFTESSSRCSAAQRRADAMTREKKKQQSHAWRRSVHSCHGCSRAAADKQQVVRAEDPVGRSWHLPRRPTLIRGHNIWRAPLERPPSQQSLAWETRHRIAEQQPVSLASTGNRWLDIKHFLFLTIFFFFSSQSDYLFCHENFKFARFSKFSFYLLCLIKKNAGW